MDIKKTTDYKKITIYDIAKEAGVSSSTVSRVLTNTAGVRQENREKVLKIIEKYDFRPNALARGLSETKRKALGIIMPDIQNPFFANLFTCCEKTASNLGYSLFLEISLSNQDLETQYLSSLDDQRMSAIILVGGQVDNLVVKSEFAEFVNRISTTTPIVVAGKLDGTFCPQVLMDYAIGVDLAMEHLLNLGHTDIAIVGGEPTVASSFLIRQRYKQIMIRNQIDYYEDFADNYGFYDINTGYQLMEKLLAGSHIPTAVIAINDLVCVGIQNCILDHNLRIPEDISIITQDNTLLCSYLRPQITSIAYDYQEFADKLINTAIATREQQDNLIQFQQVRPTLTIRNSTGPCFRKQ